MIDIKELRRNQPAIIAALSKRGFELDAGQLQSLLEQRQQLQTQVEGLQQIRNARSKAIGQAQAEGADITSMRAEVTTLISQLDDLKAELAKVQIQFRDFMLTIPNVPHESVPGGKDEQDNIELRRIKEQPAFDFVPKDHVALGEQLGYLDFKAAERIAGSRFTVLRGPLACLHNALAQLMLSVHTREHGYEQVYVPYIVNSEALIGTGQLPKFADDQFRLFDNKQDRYLIATGEIAATNLVREEILEADMLPLKLVTQTPCFRREAGSYGKDTRGMIRQHQFEKVELVQIVRPEESWQTLETLTGHAERIMDLLELPYRVVVLCAGDLGFPSAKTYDIEVWLPGQQTYREISSCSNFLDFQARRMQARWRNPTTNKPEWVHTVNGSGLAVGRTLVAVMENYQDQNGHIRVPEALAPWMGDIQSIK